MNGLAAAERHSLPTIGILDDDVDFLAEIGIDADANVNWMSTSEPEELLAWVQGRKVDIVVSDLRMPGETGVDVLEKVHSIDPSLFLALWTGFKPTADEKQRLHQIDARFISKLNHVFEDLVSYYGDKFKNEAVHQLREARLRIQALEEMNREWAADLVAQLKQIPNAQNAVISSSGNPFTVADLIDDITNLRPRGIEYIRLWRRALSTLRSNK